MRTLLLIISVLSLAFCGLRGTDELMQSKASLSEPIKNGGVLGIDVSAYQGNIDWGRVKAYGINFAILRTTVKGGDMDSTFEANYAGANANGIAVSGYHFSYSLNPEQAVADANNLIEKLGGKMFPIYIDLEWGTQGDLGKQAVTDIAKAFIQTMQAAGYEAGVYSNTNWYKNYYYPDQLAELVVKFWIAQYGYNTGDYDENWKPNVGEYIWQYTSKGAVDGIDGNVDMDMMYPSGFEESSGNGEEENTLSEIISEGIRNGGTPGIDVSAYQGTIDWAKVKKAGIKFAILRTTVKGGSMDSKFAANYKNAKANGIAVSGYHFSYSLSTAEAKKDAQNLIKKLGGKKIPIYIDLEWSSQASLGRQKVTDIAKAFITTLKNAGYQAHVYSNTNWYKNYYYPDQLKKLGCHFWIAQYGKNTGKYDEAWKPNVGEKIWQYTSVGKISGISGNVDLDMMYGSSVSMKEFVKKGIPNGGTLGIDVSSYQGTIDWAKVKNAGVKFAILRSTVKGGSMDSQFENNYANAKKNGIAVSAYHFSYSLSTSEAVTAAKNLISKLNGRKMPIYLDLEWESQGSLGKQAVTDIGVAFVKTMQAAGYETHIYSNTNWYKNYYYPAQFKALGCKFWIAQYGRNTGEYDESWKPNVGEYIWQYTSNGKVSGIQGNVDMDMMYGDTPVPPKPTSSEKMVIITSSVGVNRRASPSTSAKIVGGYTKGTIVQVVAKTSDGLWYKDTDGYYFTAVSDWVRDVVGVVTCDVLNVRDTNSTSGKVITQITNGNKVAVLKKSNGWYYVKLSSGTKGWVYGQYLSLQ